MLAGLGSVARVCVPAPRLTRTIANKAPFRPVPSPRVIPPRLGKNDSPLDMTTPREFLKAIGRSSEKQLEQPGTWEAFWKMSRNDMREAGVGVRDRRYILWCMEKYRRGADPREFAHEATPKKTVRGWGPSVQNGKRIRSRRLKVDKKVHRSAM